MPRYSEEQKGEVLALLDANDGNLKKTRRDIDWDHVPSRSTIRRWDENAQQPKAEPDRAVAKIAIVKRVSLRTASRTLRGTSRATLTVRKRSTVPPCRS